MERLIFVDSNIWCYYFDRSAQEHADVSGRLEQVLENGVAINTVVANGGCSLSYQELGL